MHNRQEKEIISLHSVVVSIDSILNHEVIELCPSGEVRCKTSVHIAFFNIILVDMLSKQGMDNPKKESSIAVLEDICRNPSFNDNCSLDMLTSAVNDIRVWMDAEFIKSVSFPSLSITTVVTISRQQYIKISGNICKHCPARLDGVAGEIEGIFSKNGITMNDEDTYLAFNDFQEWFHDDIFHYHISEIAQMLNDIRWGIHEYLVPLYNQSIQDSNDVMRQRRCICPDSIQSRYAQACFSELMGAVRSKPILKQFTCPEILTRRY